MIDAALERLRVLLVQRQSPSGGWAALASSSQPVLEPTALACVALGFEFSGARDRATQFLLRTQNSNGSWPVFLGDDHEGSWVTALALIALHGRVEAMPEGLKGFSWLLDSAGEESNWLWKWKFRTTDRHVRFDPDKFGWPWVPHTNSWVVPTAFSILALNQLACTCDLEAAPYRAHRGAEMLLDRVCPSGGWNAGNGIVYGTALSPHPDDTAIVLLALHDHPEEPAVQTSLKWLEESAPALGAPWSLAWSILALAAHRRSIDPPLESLSHFLELDQLEDTCTLALVCLALDWRSGLTALGVIV